MSSPMYLAHSVGEAAYLYTRGVPFIEARQQASRHVAFAFGNPEGLAWQLGCEWHEDACQPVNPTIFVHAYKTMTAILHATLRTGVAAHDRPDTAA